MDQAARSKLPTITAVALIYVGIGYAFITGLAQTVITEVMPVFRVQSIPDGLPPPPDPQPPVAQPRTNPETVTTVRPNEALPPIPTVRLDTLPTITDPPLPLPPLVRDEPVTPPVSRATGAAPRGNKGEWITTDDYPAVPLRARSEGVVGISVGIDANGCVSDCRVTQSSSSAALDDATCRLYQRRARFAPATDAGGGATTASYADRIRWRIPD